MGTINGIANEPGQFGVSYNVPAIADLATLSVDGFTLGTFCFVRETGDAWQLVVSSAVVDHTSVEAVSGYDDLRWVIFSPGGSGITLSGDVTGTQVDSDVATTLVKIGGVAITATGTAVMTAASVSAGRSDLGLNGLAPNAGANIADSSATIQPGTDSAGMYTLPAATLSTNRTTTLGVTSATTNMLVRLVRRDRTANTWTIANGGTNGGTLRVFPSTPTVDSCIDVFYNGVDWIEVGFTWLAGTA